MTILDERPLMRDFHFISPAAREYTPEFRLAISFSWHSAKNGRLLEPTNQISLTMFANLQGLHSSPAKRLYLPPSTTRLSVTENALGTPLARISATFLSA